MAKRIFYTGLLWCMFGFNLTAQTLPSGPQVLTFHSDIDDTEQPYGLYLPKNYNPAKKYPLVMMLHGAGSNHRLALRRVFGKSNQNGENDVETSRYFPEWKDVEYIVAAPLARGTMGYQGVAEQDVMAVLADVKKRFSIDENRTYLTGLSMGGGGTLWLGLSRPDIWAAIAPVCPAPPEGTAALASNALNIPVRIFQGGADPVVSPDSTRAWVKRFEAAGVQVSYDEFPGVLHDSWVNAYENEQVFTWFSQFTRNPFPDWVQFATATYLHNKAYWVTIDAFEPGTVGKINVKMALPNQLGIKTENISAFSLDLGSHPKHNAGAPVRLSIDGKPLVTRNTGILHFSLKDGRWSEQQIAVTATPKKAGLEGPLANALSTRHVYVYGTADNPSKEEEERRKKEALKASEWSFYRGEFLGRIAVFPRTLSDKEVRPSDLEGANLILFGTRKTNAFIEKYADKFPYHLDESETGTKGFACIVPNGDHYLVVNSGIPVWEAPEPPGITFSGLTRFSTPPYLLSLKMFKDYALFTKDRILLNDYFDNNWELSAEQKAGFK